MLAPVLRRSLPRRRAAIRGAIGPVAAVSVATCTIMALAGCTASPAPADPLEPTVLVSVDSCGQGWTTPTAGAQRMTIRNVDSRAGEVYLTDAQSGAVYADIDPIGPGTQTEMDITLTAGAYAFRCAMEDEGTVTGPTATVVGTATDAATPVAAVSQADLVPATLQYEKYVTDRLPVLARLTSTLRADLAAGDLEAARADWLPAHVEYETLGAAYGAFGDLDDRIDGLPNGLPRGPADPAWTGFHRVEFGLWHGEAASTLAPLGDDLASAVSDLSDTFAHAQIDPLQISLRAHEITENAVQFELTSATDFGSDSNLATISANLEGTTTVIDILAPLLASRDPGFSRMRAHLDSTRADVPAAGSDLRALPLATRQRLDADLSQLAEDLAPVAALLDPRRVDQ
ncbi:EfeM/EfeO family lipoprotein [Microbacterium dextranolyticum]|uniref:Iron transporter n=1 Tax=Microbacterium dextranolyticum TaxID=36806 RepID=A0A9W6HP23_9MICO|nr:iron transporter [Microbacterium dextranolyticum]